MNERQRRAAQALRDDRKVLRAAAVVLRDREVTSRWAGLDQPRTAELAAELLDGIAERLHDMDPAVRDLVARVARELTGSPMDQPSVRRTRRRG